MENNNEDAEIVLNLFFQMAEYHDLINEFFIDVLAYNYLSQRDEDILYAILKKKIEYFPNSVSAYESLAYAYYKNDKKEMAITYFETVLQLEPDNPNAVKMIKKLRNK
jgi:tetratricopeptide (TPR) repeat protein